MRLGRPAHAALFAVTLALAGCSSHDITGVASTAPEPMGIALPSTRSSVGVGGVQEIRIGVVPSATTINLGSTADYWIRDKAIGLLLVNGTNGSARVELLSSPKSYLRLQVMCASSAAVAARKAAAEAKTIITFTTFNAVANCTRLYLGQFEIPPANTFAARTAFRNAMIAEGLAATDSFYATVSTGGTSVYRVTQGSTIKETTNPVTVTSSSGIVTINGLRYRGIGEAHVNSGATLAGINQLPLEQYLYGVVPLELGPIAFPGAESQKAQAVAARTYAVAGLGKRASNFYDLLGTTADQVYGGYGAEHPLSTAAVDATAGKVLTYEGKLINALYSSTSGGHTANNEEAFNAKPEPYLRGVPDAERGQALEHVPSLDVFRFHGNGHSLRGAKEGDYDSNWGRLHRWTFEWTSAQIATVVSSATGASVGEVREINVLERGPSGRVLRLEYVTDVGTFYATRDAIRQSLRTIGAGNALVNLPSTLFFVEPVVDHQTKTVEGYRVYGGGFGHGVGMSQTGAVGMAEKGHTYEEILAHYYRGTELTSWY